MFKSLTLIFLGNNEPGAVGTTRWWPPGIALQKRRFSKKDEKMLTKGKISALMVARSRMERIQFVLKYRFETRSRKDRYAAKNTVKICLPKLETKDMLVRPKMEVRRSLRRGAEPQKKKTESESPSLALAVS